MIRGRDYDNNYKMKNKSEEIMRRRIFTEKQCQELENQVLTFRYLISGVTVPPSLLSSVLTSPTTSSSSSNSPILFPQHQHQQQQHFPFGSSYFQVGYGYGRKIDTEPGRCRRTDGKKWRCSKEAHPDSKYCERHMHRSRSKAKKQLNASTNNNVSTPKAVTNPNPDATTTTTSSATSNSYSPYPAVSYCPVSQSSYPNMFQPRSSTFYPFLSAQSSTLNDSMSARGDGASPNWLYQPQKEEEIRYTNSHTNGALTLKEEHNEEKVGENDEEHESQKLYHHFLGDWPSKLKNSHALGLFSTSN